MTREEAIELLCAYGVPQDEKRFQEVLDMAIEALSADRPTKHTLPDGSEIDIDEESYEIGYTEGQMADRPTGEWIKTEHCLNENGYRKWIELECPFCGFRPVFELIDDMNFCPNCGAKMGGNNHD